MTRLVGLPAARGLHRQPGVLNAQRDPFATQFLEVLVVPDLAAKVADPFMANILSLAFGSIRVSQKGTNSILKY